MREGGVTRVDWFRAKTVEAGRKGRVRTYFEQKEPAMFIHTDK